VLATYVVEKGKPVADSDQVPPGAKRGACAVRRRVRSPGARARRAPRPDPMAALAPDPSRSARVGTRAGRAPPATTTTPFGSLTRQAVDPLLDAAEGARARARSTWAERPG